jgi:hypothetical protein
MPLTAGAVYLIRNPLDVAVSLAYHMNKPIDGAIEFMSLSNASVSGDVAAVLTGSWSQNVASWAQNQSEDIGVIRYEDLLNDADLWFGAITRLIFGDGVIPSESIHEAIVKSSFQRLRAQEDAYGYVGAATGAERFFRAGHAGQWKDVLNVQQVERIVGVHGAYMKQFGYLPIA